MIIDISDCSTPFNPKRIVVIDAGHGGKDIGAAGNGVVEKVLNLQFATLLAKALDAEGYRVELTRDSDKYIRLTPRRDFRPGKLFLSIHHNSAANKNARGVEVYYKSGSLGNKKLAEHISAEIACSCGLKNRGAKEGRFTVLQRCSPAVLIELGFISNASEAVVVSSEAFKTTAAQAIIRCIQKI